MAGTGWLAGSRQLAQQTIRDNGVIDGTLLAYHSKRRHKNIFLLRSWLSSWQLAAVTARGVWRGIVVAAWRRKRDARASSSRKYRWRGGVGVSNNGIMAYHQ